MRIGGHIFEAKVFQKYVLNAFLVELPAIMMIVKDIEYFALTEQILLAYVVDEEDGDEALSFDDVVSELKE